MQNIREILKYKYYYKFFLKYLYILVGYAAYPTKRYKKKIYFLNIYIYYE